MQLQTRAVGRSRTRAVQIRFRQIRGTRYWRESQALRGVEANRMPSWLRRAIRRTQGYQYPSAENLFGRQWRKEVLDFRNNQESHSDWIAVEPIHLFWKGVVLDRPYKDGWSPTSCVNEW